MKRSLTWLMLLVFFCNIAFTQDVKVFDITLGDSMRIRECGCKIVESAYKSGLAVKRNKWRGLAGKNPDILKMYSYTENIPKNDKCFQRVGLYYTEEPTPGTTEAEKLPPILPANNEKVKLIYSEDKRPGIADAEDIWIGIQDYKVTGIRFYFNFHNADSVYQALIKKYGKISTKKDYFVMTPAGKRKDYYEAKWQFPKLTVTFLSIDTNQIGYSPNDTPLGYLSAVGSVTIQYILSDQKKDGNKL